MSMETRRALRFALSGVSVVILIFIMAFNDFPDFFPEAKSYYSGMLFGLLMIAILYFVSYSFWTFALRIKKQPVQDNNFKQSHSSRLLLGFLTIFMGIELWVLMVKYLIPNIDPFGIIGGIIAILFYIPIAFGVSYITMSSLLKSLKIKK